MKFTMLFSCKLETHQSSTLLYCTILSTTLRRNDPCFNIHNIEIILKIVPFLLTSTAVEMSRFIESSKSDLAIGMIRMAFRTLSRETWYDSIPRDRKAKETPFRNVKQAVWFQLR